GETGDYSYYPHRGHPMTKKKNYCDAGTNCTVGDSEPETNCRHFEVCELPGMCGCRTWADTCTSKEAREDGHHQHP
ncbi:MAG: hypothetical protein WC476_12825, partial [Phycisphaerae bacterium]